MRQQARLNVQGSIRVVNAEYSRVSTWSPEAHHAICHAIQCHADIGPAGTNAGARSIESGGVVGPVLLMDNTEVCRAGLG